MIRAPMFPASPTSPEIVDVNALIAESENRIAEELLAAQGSGPRILVTRESDTVTYAAAVDASLIATGRETFEKVCAQCHGKLGEGGVGPNLTDDYWLHGADITSVVKSVKYGYPAKGMIPWRGTLAEDEIINVSSYVLTLRGTNPPNAKAPQGELVTE